MENYIFTTKLTFSIIYIFSILGFNAKILNYCPELTTPSTIDTNTSLHLPNVVVPRLAVRGQSVILQCPYELQGSMLYSVKWYKDNEEFFNFLLRATPQIQSYPVTGVEVNHKVSNSSQVELKSVSLKSTGVYKCEVSAEAPAFTSAQSEDFMEVIYPAQDGPYIKTIRKQNGIHDIINANCTSGKSFPASTLRWFINSKQVLNNDSLLEYHHIHDRDGLVTTILSIQLVLTAEYFVDSKISLRCISLYSSNNEEDFSLSEHTKTLEQQLKHQREADLHISSEAVGCTTASIGVIVMITAMFIKLNYFVYLFFNC